VAGLSYLDVLRLSGDVFLGGLLTVNETGLPTEFIYSEPVRPSKLQVSLYGSTLGRYLMLDVVGKGLVDASQSRGMPVVVAQGDMLPLATRVKRPVCHLRQSAMRPLEQTGQVMEQTADEVLVQLTDVSSPWHLRFYDRQNFPVEQHMPALLECAKRFDLLEPLTRVKRTLETLKGGSEVEQ
jgi:hypothetical protein